MKKLTFIFLLTQCLRAGAELPTIGSAYVDNGTSLYLTNQQFYAATNPAYFSYLGLPPQFADASTNGFVSTPPNIGEMTEQPFIGIMCVDVSFWWTGQQFELRVFANAGNMSISDSINTTNDVGLDQNNSPARFLIQYPESRLRKMNLHIDMVGAHTNVFSGIYLNSASDSISPVSSTYKKLLVLGDSYDTGYQQSPNVTYWESAYPFLMAELWTNVAVLPEGLSGTGVANIFNTTNYIGRWQQDVVANNPDFVAIQMSINDGQSNSVNASAFFGQCTNLFALAEATYPGRVAVIGVLDPWDVYGDGSINNMSVNTNAAAAAAAIGVPFIDPLGPQGTNMFGSNTFSTYFVAGGAHPKTQAGYQVMATFIGTNLANTFGAALTNFTYVYTASNMPVISGAIMSGAYMAN